MKPQEAAIQEFQALRAEILSHFDRRSSRLNIVWAGISGLIAAAAFTKIPEISVVALLTTCTGWRDELKLSDNITRIGAYIRNVIEPNVAGLQWERAFKTALQSTRTPYTGKKKAWIQIFRIPKKILTKVFSPIFSTYGILVVTCIASSLFMFFEFMPKEPARVYTFLFALTIGIIFSSRMIYISWSSQTKAQKWDEIFAKIANDFSFNK